MISPLILLKTFHFNAPRKFPRKWKMSGNSKDFPKNILRRLTTCWNHTKTHQEKLLKIVTWSEWKLWPLSDICRTLYLFHSATILVMFLVSYNSNECMHSLHRKRTKLFCFLPVSVWLHSWVTLVQSVDQNQDGHTMIKV